jgi:acetyl esterase/lipase
LVVKDGDYKRVDPAKSSFSATFPPVMFVHGTSDTAVPHELRIRAHKELKALGAPRCEILLVDGVDHMFDMPLKPEDALFKDYVLKPLEFLNAAV